MSEVNADHLISLSEPEISGNEWEYIKDCLDTGWVSSVESYVSRFEERVAEYVGCKYGIIESALSVYDTAMNLPCSIGIKEDYVKAQKIFEEYKYDFLPKDVF